MTLKEGFFTKFTWVGPILFEKQKLPSLLLLVSKILYIDDILNITPFTVRLFSELSSILCYTYSGLQATKNTSHFLIFSLHSCKCLNFSGLSHVYLHRHMIGSDDTGPINTSSGLRIYWSNHFVSCFTLNTSPLYFQLPLELILYIFLITWHFEINNFLIVVNIGR